MITEKRINVINYFNLYDHDRAWPSDATVLSEFDCEFHTSIEFKKQSGDFMAYRNLSAQNMFAKLALQHNIKYKFDVEPRPDFAAWKRDALPEVLATLGNIPKSVPADPELQAEWTDDGLTKQRWVINVGEHIAAIFLVNFREDIPAGEKRPAILCWHGHGQFGKDTVMGNVAGAAHQAELDNFNYDYGHKMAKLGFVTFAIDWIGIGDRNETFRPNYNSQAGNRDWCNLYYLHATMLGSTSLAFNLVHGKAATDFACTLPQVDADNLGVMGLSGGGTMTTWSALFDERFKAVEIICYSDLFENFGFAASGYCGMQVSPGLYSLVDVPELQGLIAPRALLVDIGVHDKCFEIDGALKCYNRVKDIYAAADASDNLEIDLFPAGHQWSGNKSEAFFKKHLWK